jgi:hypothetical protein
MSASRWLIVASIAVAAALVIAYLAAGGGEYKPTQVADPCAPRAWTNPQGIEDAAEQFTLSALDGAACEIGASREELAIGLVTEEGRQELADKYAIDDAELDAAVHAGFDRAIDDAVRAGALSPVVADGLRAAADQLPVDQTIALIENATSIFSGAGGLLDQLGL